MNKWKSYHEITQYWDDTNLCPACSSATAGRILCDYHTKLWRRDQRYHVKNDVVSFTQFVNEICRKEAMPFTPELRSMLNRLHNTFEPDERFTTGQVIKTLQLPLHRSTISRRLHSLTSSQHLHRHWMHARGC